LWTLTHQTIITSLSLNVGNFIILKFKPTNYPLWHEQALALVESQDLVGHLTNEDPFPTKYTTPDLTTPLVQQPSYSKLISQLQSLDQCRNWFSSRSNMQNSFAPQMAFYEQQQSSRQKISWHWGNSQAFTSTSRGFHAQQPSNQDKNYPSLATKQRRPAPPGERHTTPAKQEHDRNEKCQYCDVVGQYNKDMLVGAI
jgi:hypothetical protein